MKSIHTLSFFIIAMVFAYEPFLTHALVSCCIVWNIFAIYKLLVSSSKWYIPNGSDFVSFYQFFQCISVQRTRTLSFSQLFYDRINSNDKIHWGLIDTLSWRILIYYICRWTQVHVLRWSGRLLETIYICAMCMAVKVLQYLISNRSISALLPLLFFFFFAFAFVYWVDIFA